MMNHQPVTPMVERLTINSNIAVVSNAEIGNRCIEPGPSVVAEEFLRPESKSAIIALDPRRFTPHHQQFKVSLSKGELTSSPPSSLWPMSIEVATECRMQNVECSTVSSTSGNDVNHLSLTFTTTRPIEKGQRLYFWFSEAMLARLEMPFLVPKNIQAGDRYVCHRCSSVFVNPNPLKLHLFFHCSNRSVSTSALWNRVFHTLTKPESPPVIPFQQQSSRNVLCKPTPTHLFQTFAAGNNQRTTGTSPAAQVETIVSHLGRSKHGHICIYCGKIYSRKYGLKIHIRTHTGYKPLKCPVCSRPFGDPSNLNKHIRLHAEHHHQVGLTGDKSPYKCELCGKVLMRRRDLDRHIQSRHTSVDSPIVRHQPSSADSIDCPSPLSSTHSSISSNNNSDDDEDQLDVVDIC
ncbi:PR domain zinc finger protein 13-like [Daphnia carinata]|uniref:PR domain zinc finger protein 13-like n=1 Tax=Daphnia carinata TaxID=120202 RepID=UPI00257991B0|nr:PR domain zinc finger protein 13-like [Daphnia carinata]